MKSRVVFITLNMRDIAEQSANISALYSCN